MDDRTLFRFKPGYATPRSRPRSTGRNASSELRLRRRGGDVQQQRPLPEIRRRRDVPVATASTRDEKHVTRGRANTLRLALSGQLGPERAGLDAMHETLDLCVSLQGLQARMPDRRRHGADEDRVPAPASHSATALGRATG